MNNGWVKLHRQILDNDVFRNDRTAWHVFEILLVIADKKSGTWSGGRKQLAFLSGVNENTLKDALKRLKNHKMVTQASNTKYSVIAICNWKKYQSTEKAVDTQADTQTTPKRHPNDTTLTRIKNKELRNNSTNVLLGETPKYGNSEINELFDYWEATIGYKIDARKQRNRNACSNLLKKYGKDKLESLMRGVALSMKDQFAPNVADFIELEQKSTKLINWGIKKGVSGNDTAIID